MIVHLVASNLLIILVVIVVLDFFLQQVFLCLDIHTENFRDKLI